MKRILGIVLAVFIFSCTAQDAGVIKENIDVKTFKEKVEQIEDEIILDVRTPDEWSTGTIPNAIKINWFDEAFETEALKLDKEKAIFVYCAKGGRSAQAMEKLSSLGFKKIYNLKGGMGAWQGADYPIQN